MKREKLEGFDGLRALAALTVVTYHVALSGKFAQVGSLAPMFWELKGGVAIFFVISGALLYLPFARSIRDCARLPDWRVYGRRRAVRSRSPSASTCTPRNKPICIKHLSA